MILHDKDFDLVVDAIERASKGNAPEHCPKMYEAYSRILESLKAYKKRKQALLKNKWQVPLKWKQ